MIQTHYYANSQIDTTKVLTIVGLVVQDATFQLRQWMVPGLYHVPLQYLLQLSETLLQ